MNDASTFEKDGHDERRSSRLLFSVVVAAVIAVIGGVLASGTMATRALDLIGLVPEPSSEAGDLWFAVQSTTWVDAPHRLHIELKVQNRGDRTRMLGPQDFRLRAAAGTTWWPIGRTFAFTPLGPREYVHGVLTFDVPEAVSDLELVWSRFGDEVRLRVEPPASGTGTPSTRRRTRGV